ncbi:hypothetical protein HanPI659440_Chr04g0172711 [Helianthus annuus]|nr:hypothetical protein HanPI659440_Chr04g0172711 [Helianthus annuus]
MIQMPQTLKSPGLVSEWASLQLERQLSSRDRQQVEELRQDPRPQMARPRKARCRRRHRRLA